MAKIDLKVSMETFNEIANALEARGEKVNSTENIVLTKDVSIKGPIDYRQVTIRKDVLVEVAKVYKTPLINDFEVSNSKHFIDFLDDVYNYILKGERLTVDTPTAKVTTVKTPNKW